MIGALARLLPYLVRVRRSFLIGLACIVLATAVSLISPWVLKNVVDGLTQGVSHRQLGLYAVVIVGLAVADGALRYVMRRRIIGASRQIEYALRSDFFRHLIRLQPAYFQNTRTGDLMSRATNDLSAVRMMIGPAIMYATSTALGFVIAVVVMTWIDWRLTLIALLPLPGVTLATRYFGQAIHDRFERIQAQLADMSAIVQESFSGVRVVKAYVQEAAELERFGRANDEYVERNRSLIQLQAAFYPSLTFCFGLSGLLVLWFGGRAVVEGRLTLGEFVAFGRYLVLLGWPLIAFGWVINLAQRGLASWGRMVEVLDVLPRLDAPDAATRPAEQATEGHVAARRLSFTYPGAGERALDDVSFNLPAGRTLAIVGATGSGKSTLVNLIPRLMEPSPGSLFVDGIDVGMWRLGELRGAIAMVAEEPFLFSDTIGGNIVFGLGDAWGTGRAREVAARAASLAGLDADLASFPAGLDTVVGERGITLSGGQKQRVALARALALDARILILDDALSAVDTATEEVILKNLRAARASRTAVIVAHRISTVRDADEILVLARGRLVEHGTHDELVLAGGLYAEMHRRQILEAELSGA